MTKAELLDSLVHSTGLLKKDIEKTLEAGFDHIALALTRGERIDFRGFGTFEAKETKPRTGRNPATGELIEIPAGRRIAFRPSRDLKQRVAKTLA
jgi:DNA-binding protein HU-beta